MQILKTNNAIKYYDVPANTIIYTDYSQSWIDGEAPDRYAGSLYVWRDGEHGKMFYCHGFLSEDCLATIGMFDDVDPNSIGHSGSTSQINVSELPKDAFNYLAKRKNIDIKFDILARLKRKKHFIKLATILSCYSESEMNQASEYGINITSVATKLVTAHNDNIAKIRSDKEQYIKSVANSLENLCPSLKSIL